METDRDPDDRGKHTIAVEANMMESGMGKNQLVGGTGPAAQWPNCSGRKMEDLPGHRDWAPGFYNHIFLQFFDPGRPTEYVALALGQDGGLHHGAQNRQSQTVLSNTNAPTATSSGEPAPMIFH